MFVLYSPPTTTYTTGHDTEKNPHKYGIIL